MTSHLNDRRFQKYLELLLKWNRTFNLTAITDPEEIRIKHFYDSLSLLPFLPEEGRFLDLGTGAGFPGIPVKIARPDLYVVLLDSRQKKISFCETVIRELGLKGIEAIWERAEDKEIQKKLGLFDVVVSRATFSIVDFLNLALPYCKENSAAIVMKGPREKAPARLENWEFKSEISYLLPKRFGCRTLFIFQPYCSVKTFR